MHDFLTHLDSTITAIARQLTYDAALQEDLAQEMRFHLWEVWSQQDDHTESWYLESCRHRAIDYLRRGRSLDRQGRTDHTGTPTQAPLEDQTARSGGQAHLPAEETTVVARQFLHRLLSRLSGSQEHILIYALKCYTEREMSGYEGISQQAIHQQWQGIRLKAQHLLERREC